jgi:hypothetical protein
MLATGSGRSIEAYFELDIAKIINSKALNVAYRMSVETHFHRDE